MVTRPRKPEDCALAYETWVAKGKSYQKGADALGWDRSTFTRHVQEHARRGEAGTSPVLPGFRISQTTTVTNAEGETVREFVQQRPDLGPEFVVPDGHRVKGVSTLTDGNGNVIQQWTKTKADELSPDDWASVLGEALSGYRGGYQKTGAPDAADSDLLTLYPLVDWHVGLLAWAEETGENYDLSIARDVILRSMRRLIDASPPAKQAVVLGLGDLLHFDGYEPVTSRSRNFLDADGRYPKVLKTAVQMVIATIDMAAERHESVLVRILPGNHDDQSAVAVGLALSLFYEGHPRITVDDSPSRFWWHRFGKVFLGATHGDKAKMRDLPLVMAADRPHDWAASTYRRIVTGHIHHESRVEEGGVIVSSMRTPVAKDAYHSFEKYRAGRSVYSETFRSDGSEAATIQFNL